MLFIVLLCVLFDVVCCVLCVVKRPLVVAVVMYGVCRVLDAVCCLLFAA